MSQITLGCQFYTWQMSGQRYVGQLTHILNIVRAAGFSGIEPETLMLGSYYDDPKALEEIITQFGLKLGAITLVCDWSGPVETEAEKREAEYIFKYMQYFPDTHLVLCQMPGEDRSNLLQRQENAIACVNQVARQAADLGIKCSFHPNSPPGSVFRTKEDYQKLLDNLDSRVVGFAPDTGHIVKGGMDAAEIIQSYISTVKHIHFKDITASNQWTAMGKGTIGFPQIVKILKDYGYDGWIMIEEESALAEIDPDKATIQNGEYIQRSLLPIV
jgi:inosose dehydratase